MSFLHINDPEVEQMIERAAGAACSALDESFPGKDGHHPGITSNFQGLLSSADEIDPYTSFGAAVQGAMNYLTRNRCEADEELPTILPVFMTETGYSLEPPQQAAA